MASDLHQLVWVLNPWDYLSELLKASCRPAQGHFQSASGLQFTNLSQLPCQAQQSYFMNSHHDSGTGMAHLISRSPSTPLSATLRSAGIGEALKKTNVRSIHPQCRYYSWILRHRRLGRFEKTLTPSQTSAWLSFHIWSCYSRCTPAVLQVNWWRGMQHPQVRPRRDALIPGNLDESVAL